MQLQVALHIFYQRHNPAMVQSASSIAAAHHGKVEELNTKLRKMYGADLNDIAGFTLSGCTVFASHRINLIISLIWTKQVGVK